MEKKHQQVVDLINPNEGQFTTATTETENGIISESMGVNTKPAHKLEWEGFWILVDPTMPNEALNFLKYLIFGITK